jgi:hypothetical protein
MECRRPFFPTSVGPRRIAGASLGKGATLLLTIVPNLCCADYLSITSFFQKVVHFYRNSAQELPQSFRRLYSNTKGGDGSVLREGDMAVVRVKMGLTSPHMRDYTQKVLMKMNLELAFL